LSPGDLDVSTTNVHAEEHAFTKPVDPVHPQFLQWDLEASRGFTSVHELTEEVTEELPFTHQTTRNKKLKKLTENPVEIGGDR